MAIFLAGGRAHASVLQETFYEGDLNLRELGARCCSFWEACLRRAHEDLAAHRGTVGGGKASAGAHVKYAELIKDPLGTVKGLYAQFGWEYTEAFDAALKAYLEENTRQVPELKGAVLKARVVLCAVLSLTLCLSPFV